MIALDTNVLVRFLVEDDAAQSRRARRLIASAIAANEVCFVSDVVLCELVWVLQVSYRIERKAIMEVLTQLFFARHILFASHDRISRTLDAFRAGRGDFADYLVREHARTAGCPAVATFDRALLKEDGFVSP